MTKEFSPRLPIDKVASPSHKKSLRTTLLAVLFHVTWPHRLTGEEITRQIQLYGGNPKKALFRDIETLTGTMVEKLPEPDALNLEDWCAAQREAGRLALTYKRYTNKRGAGTFGLAQSFFMLDISEDEARAFVALREGFTPGTPYEKPVQYLLARWEWLFTEKGHRLVQQKQQRRARPVLIPLSPVVDYSQHHEMILMLDQALEEGIYISFAYTPLSRHSNDPPEMYKHVEPYELEYRDGHWYFTAFVPDIGMFLDYRVDRMTSDSLHKEPDRFLPGGRTRRGVKISYWVSPMLARRGSLSARLSEQKVTLLDHDQGAIVEGYAQSAWWARRLLLGYGDQVMALAPDELVAMMRDSIRTMHRLYEDEK
jgi:hypothetical protein